MAQSYSHEEYTIAWICALPLELQAAIALLDERHPPLTQDESDTNQYVLGRISHRNIVILCLPAGEYGITNAATTIVHLRRSFLSVREGLMVGIGGGAPIPLKNDIRLGDVVVGQPGPGHGGVLQYDFGKLTDGEFVSTKVSNKPPKAFLNTVSKLRAEDEQLRDGVAAILAEALEKKRVPKAFSRPKTDTDRLFESTYKHDQGNENCDFCEESEVVKRLDREHEQPLIHYGLIASANQVMKDSSARDKLSRDKGVLCFEMEASGVVDEIPTLVVRGICDYSDSHKAKIWQPYAALVAAAYAKEFLHNLPLPRKRTTPKPKNETKDIDAEPCLKELLKSGSNPKIDKERIEDSKDRLLPDIYSWVLQNEAFQSWYNGKSQPILRISGDPGKGKTMMMIGIIDELKKRAKDDSSTSVAYFFCQRTDPRLDNAASVLKGLLFSILSENRNLVHHLNKPFGVVGANLFTGTQAIYQLQTTLFDIFSDPKAPDLYIIVDALDECSGQIESLLGFITKSVTKSSKVRWLVTSRNYLNIEEMLRANEVQIKISLEHHHLQVTEAVESYVREKVSYLSRMKGYTQKLQYEVTQILRERSGGTFLWVHLACKRLESIRRIDVLTVLEDIPPGLEAIYETMLREVERTSEPALISKVLTSSILAQRPLNLSEVAIFVEVSLENLDDVEDIIASCGSFLIVRDETIFFLHQSAKEFLDERVGSMLVAPFGLSNAHFILFKRSLDVVHSDLKEDICDLGFPGCLREELTDSHQKQIIHLDYICLYWVEHLERSISLGKQPVGPKRSALMYMGLKVSMLLGLHILYIIAMAAFPDNLVAIAFMKFGGTLLNVSIASAFIGTLWLLDPPIQQLELNSEPERIYHRNLGKFFREDFLHWIEFLSIVGKISNGIRMMKSLKNIIKEKENRSLFSTREDAERFLLSHRSTFDVAPLQVYSSAILFSPRRSILRKYYLDRTPDWVQVDSNVEDDWDICLQTFRFTEDSDVNDLSFSPDKKSIAASYHTTRHGTTQILDADTGALQRVFKHPAPVLMHVFSPDSQLLAICDSQHNVTVLDLKTGLEEIQKHYSDEFGVTYTPDGNLVTAHTGGRILTLVNRATGSQRTFEYEDDISKIKFSQSGRLLAVACDNGSINIIHLYTNTKWLFEHPDEISQMSFSYNDRRFISGSEDGTVCLWDLVKDERLSIKKNDSSGPLELSCDGKLIYSTESEDLVIQNIANNVEVKSILGHISPITKIAPSSDDRLIVTSSDDETLRLWSLLAFKGNTTSPNHLGRILDLVISPNGNLIATCAKDQTICLWDAHTSAHKKTIHTSWTSFHLKFSPDGVLLASRGSDRGRFHIWNVVTGKQSWTFEESTRRFTLDFSPDGHLLAYSTTQGVRIYDLVTGVQKNHLKLEKDDLLVGIDNDAVALTFSCSGKQLAVGNLISGVFLWNIETSTIQHKFQSDSGGFDLKLALAFSPNDKYILSRGDDRLCIMDTTTGEERGFKFRESTLIVEYHFTFDNVLLHLKHQTGDSALDQYIDPQALERTKKCKFLDINKNTGWVRVGSSRQLFVPLEFMGARVFEDMVVVWSGTGRILTLKFLPEKIP